MSDEHTELLLSRLAADEGTAEDWETFATLAAGDLALWRDLAEMQRDQMLLTSTINTAAATADSVPLPATPVRDRSWTLVVRAWSGWAVAAVITIVALVRFADRVEPVPENPVGAVADTGGDGWMRVGDGPRTPEEALEAYFQLGQARGTVLGEMPTRVLMGTRPLPSGDGYELLYLRQFLEREEVPDLYRLEGQTEQGDPALVRYERPAHGAM